MMLPPIGFEVGPIAWLDAPAGPDAAEFGVDKVMAKLETMDLSGADGVLLPDTAMPGFELVSRPGIGLCLEAGLDRAISSE